MTTLNHHALAIIAEVQRRQQAGASMPSVRELQRLAAVASPSGVQQYLIRLRELGLLTWEHGKNRTLRLTCRLSPA